LEKLSFTLYEVFGYFLPGTIGLLASAVFFWAVFLPGAPIPVQSVELSKLWYFGLIALAYFSGHVVQSISRLFFKNPDDSVLKHLYPGTAAIVSHAREHIAMHLGTGDVSKLSDSAVVKLCDEVAVQYGQLGDRDVFVYREGFYRGSFAAFALLDVALLFRLIIPGSRLVFADKHTFDITRTELAFLMVLVTVGITFLLNRYKHFAALRVMRGVFAFVSLACFKELGKSDDKAQSAMAPK
jgi:hypothetical protein